MHISFEITKFLLHFVVSRLMVFSRQPNLYCLWKLQRCDSSLVTIVASVFGKFVGIVVVVCKSLTTRGRRPFSALKKFSLPVNSFRSILYFSSLVRNYFDIVKFFHCLENDKRLK